MVKHSIAQCSCDAPHDIRVDTPPAWQPTRAAYVGVKAAVNGHILAVNVPALHPKISAITLLHVQPRAAASVSRQRSMVKHSTSMFLHAPWQTALIIRLHVQPQEQRAVGVKAAVNGQDRRQILRNPKISALITRLHVATRAAKGCVSSAHP
jgi:hypothetical protein